MAITYYVKLGLNMATRLDSLKESRLKKLEAIRATGVDPYPAKFDKKQTCFQARKLLGDKVAIAGRLITWREHGGSTFADLGDESGKIQLFFKKDNLGEKRFNFLKFFDTGDFVGIVGEVFKTQAGEITILVNDYQLLVKALRPLPEKFHGLTDIETRLRKRYLDLLSNPEVREMFVQKAKFWQIIRQYLCEKGFLEVETPVLEAVPGGADARPFITHHNALDTDFYLRISLELHLKRLLVGGFEKVFEIGRVFRNEGIDAEHLQDYTQLEFYWAYADYKDLMKLLVEMYRKVIEATCGTLKVQNRGIEVDWGKEWKVYDYYEIFKEKTGLDINKIAKDELKTKAKALKLPFEESFEKGKLIDLIYKKLVRPFLINPGFLINPPVEIEPLAKRLPEVPSKVQRLQIVAWGTELGKGFSELNDSQDQAKRFEEQNSLRKAGDEEAQMYDEDFSEALEYGMPPTAGFGLSERLFAFLVDKPIRETVFFPLMRPTEEK